MDFRCLVRKLWINTATLLVEVAHEFDSLIKYIFQKIYIEKNLIKGLLINHDSRLKTDSAVAETSFGTKVAHCKIDVLIKVNFKLVNSFSSIIV